MRYPNHSTFDPLAERHIPLQHSSFGRILNHASQRSYQRLKLRVCIDSNSSTCVQKHPTSVVYQIFEMCDLKFRQNFATFNTNITKFYVHKRTQLKMNRKQRTPLFNCLVEIPCTICIEDAPPVFVSTMSLQYMSYSKKEGQFQSSILSNEHH